MASRFSLLSSLDSSSRFALAEEGSRAKSGSLPAGAGSGSLAARISLPALGAWATWPCPAGGRRLRSKTITNNPAAIARPAQATGRRQRAQPNEG
jgi:hypothetical protein